MSDDISAEQISNLVRDANLSTGVEVVTPVEQDETPVAVGSSRDGFVLSQEAIDWLGGIRAAPPAQMAQMMADIANKVGCYQAYAIIKRSQSFDRLMTQLNDIEVRLFPDNVGVLTDDQLKERHSTLSFHLKQFLESARKFSSQVKHVGVDPERDEILNLVRSLDTTSLDALKGVLREVVKRRTGVVKTRKEQGDGVSER